MGRDRLRELLDAALGEADGSLPAMAGRANSSPFHFARQISRGAREAPVALRRRVMLERARWRLTEGASVTEVALEAGYESTDGFARAFARAWGHPPSATPKADGAARYDAQWLSAPNGIHFHPPFNLWLSQQDTELVEMPVTMHLIHHDLDDTRTLLLASADLDPDQLDAVGLPGMRVLAFNGAEESLRRVLGNLVHSKEIWLAALQGHAHPGDADESPSGLLRRHDQVAAAWSAQVREIERRGAWNDQFVDALCEPPESFVVSSVMAHVLTHSAQRRGLVRHLLRQHGVRIDDGDPINWLREGSRYQEER
ncbi:helix-turn-helix domain-containing protein [Nocardioides sp. Bht2]|uniref:helix-turn-helix domain-containing protein n=1 Tax=Nocardioides sp. Bht2 TaxID=3392297 RepID=UPI0039B3E945